MDRKRCTRCLVSLPLNHFDIKRSGDYYKMCKHCIDVKKAYVIKTKNKDISDKLRNTPIYYFNEL